MVGYFSFLSGAITSNRDALKYVCKSPQKMNTHYVQPQ